MTTLKTAQFAPGDYFDGEPTAPDVEKILNRYPANVLHPGVSLDRKAIASLIETQFRSVRYMTVEGAFRRKLEREQNIKMKPVRDLLYVLDAQGRIMYASFQQRTGGRMIRRGGQLTKKTNVIGLPPEVRRIAEKQKEIASKLAGYEREAKKKLKAPEIDRAKKTR